jgi:nickel transport protein
MCEKTAERSSENLVTDYKPRGEQMAYRTGLFLMLALVSILLLDDPCLGHGTTYRVLDEQCGVAMEFLYSSGEPMSYAEVTVWHPDDKKVKHQKARTDRHGCFAFLPSEPGEWQVIVNDGLGHQVSAVVATNPRGMQTKKRSQEEPVKQGAPWRGLWGAVLGISLIGNLTWGASLLRGKWSPSHRSRANKPKRS